MILHYFMPQILHQASRLSNTERSLSFQAMRQLYVACIVSVADYGVPIWWDNQKILLDKYQKLQNLALRKILGAFKTSPIMAMELEAAIPPPKIRFNKICMNYSLRIIQLFKNHPPVAVSGLVGEHWSRWPIASDCSRSGV